MTQKSAAQDAAGSWLNSAWLYEQIMRQIEPDLLPGALSRLDEKYAGETAEERAVRMQRYEEAFRVFDESLASLDGHLVSEAREYRARQQRQSRLREDAESQEELRHIERRMSDAA